MECLITTLRGSVTDDRFPKLGILTFVADSVPSVSYANSAFAVSYYSGQNDNKIKVYYEDGTTQITTANFNPSKQVKKIELLDKYVLTRNTLLEYRGTRYHLEDASMLRGCSANLTSLDVSPLRGTLKDIQHLVNLKSIKGTGFGGSLSDLAPFTKLEELSNMTIAEEINLIAESQRPNRSNGKICFAWNSGQILIGGVKRLFTTEYNYLVWEDSSEYVYVYANCTSSDTSTATTIYVYNMTQEEIDARKSGIWSGKSIVKCDAI